MPAFWDWLLKTDAGLLVRVGVGVAILSAMALAEWRRRGRQAQRWREYLFLAACAGVGIIYGLINDQVTVGISWEYFVYGKGIDARGAALRWEVAKMGMKAAWSVGLIAGVVLLVANNPSKRLSRLSYLQLARVLAGMLVATALISAIFGVIGSRGWLNWTNRDLAELARDGLWRPARFSCVYGIHLGAYAGGALSVLAAAWWIRRKRRSMTAIAASTASLAPGKPELPGQP